MVRLAAIFLLIGSACMIGCSQKNEAAAKRVAFEAEGWEFLENVGVPVEDGVFMASMSTGGMSTNASVAAVGVDGTNRVEKKFSSEQTLFLVAGFQSPTSGKSDCMVFRRQRPAEEKWWSIWMTEGKVPEEEVTLGPGEKRTLSISREGSVRLGVLVREALDMKRSLEGKDGSNAGVYLTQGGSGKYVGTYHSASVAFDLASGREFTVENRSSVRSDILVYLGPAK